MSRMPFYSAMAKRLMSTSRFPAPFAASSSSPSSLSASELIVCGRGDKRTKKGKRFKGTFGNSRPKKKDMVQRIKDKIEVPRSTPWPLPFKLI